MRRPRPFADVLPIGDVTSATVCGACGVCMCVCGVCMCVCSVCVVRAVCVRVRCVRGACGVCMCVCGVCGVCMCMCSVCGCVRALTGAGFVGLSPGGRPTACPSCT